MPFVSKAQQKYMFAKHPQIAARWAKETSNFEGLPTHVKKTTLKNILKQRHTGQGGSFPNLEKNKVEFPRQSAPNLPLQIKQRPGSPSEPSKYRPDWMPQLEKSPPYQRKPLREIPPMKKLPKQLPKATPKQNTADILQSILRKREHIGKNI